MKPMRPYLWSSFAAVVVVFAGCGEGDPDGPTADSVTTGASDAMLDGDASEVTDGAGHSEIKQDAAGPPPFWMPVAGGFTVLFVDVEQGDATVVIAPDGSTMLIDGGKSPKLMAARLEALKLHQIDIVVATHADADHIGGLQAAFDAFDVGTVYWNGNTKETNLFDKFLETSKDEGAQLLVPKRGETFQLGGMKIEVVHPSTLTGDHNEDSIVLMLGCSGSWVLLTGDAEDDAEEEMLEKFGISDIEVLKVGHHGSKSSTTQAFLDAVKPKDAIISAGRNNIYDHPDDVTVEKLKKSGAKITVTDVNDGDDTVMMSASCKAPYVMTRPFW